MSEIYLQAVIPNTESGCPFTFQFVAPQKSDHIPDTHEPASVVCADSRFDDVYPLSLSGTFNFKPRKHGKCNWFTIHSPSKPVLCIRQNPIPNSTMGVKKPTAHCLVSIYAMSICVLKGFCTPRDFCALRGIWSLGGFYTLRDSCTLRGSCAMRSSCVLRGICTMRGNGKQQKFSTYAPGSKFSLASFSENVAALLIFHVGPSNSDISEVVCSSMSRRQPNSFMNRNRSSSIV